MKKLWHGIKSIISNNSSLSSISKIKDKNGNLTSNPSEIPNVFNDFFVTVSNEITRSIPKANKSPIEYLRNRNPVSILLSPVTAIEVNRTILNLDQTKSIGPYSIPIKALKILGPKIFHPLTKIINLSFTKGIFPSKLKIAKVISIFKKGDPEVPSNYRPISLLPIFSKIFEKLMYERIYSFLKEQKLIYPLQFGFRETHCIDHVLINN